MNLTFHIIFCPGTVRYLRLAVLSLLRYSDYQFRLVANGLDLSELSELGRFCRTSSRLELIPFPTKAMLPHGVLLSLLQQREQGERFCFMDPDIFASARFQEDLEQHLVDTDVYSSCDLMRFDHSESLVGVGGRCRQTPEGLPLAATYFAVYRQESLRRVIAETGVGFEAYASRDYLSDHVLLQLKRLGASPTEAFDTGKLLNVLSHQHQLRFCHVELGSLTHIGGITNGFKKAGWLKERVCKTFHRPYVLRDEDLEPTVALRGKAQIAASRFGLIRASVLQTQFERQRVRLRRRRIAKFFAFFMESLVDGTATPRLELRDQQLTEKITGLCGVIRRIFDDSLLSHADYQATGAVSGIQTEGFASVGL